MNQIKVRIWDAERNIMLDPNVIDLFLDCVGNVFSYSALGRLIPIKHLKPLLFTGLKDKNGVGIYEGDIIRQEYSAVFNTTYDSVSLGFIDQETDEGHHIGEVVILASKGVCMKNPVRHSICKDEPSMTNQYKTVASYRSEVIGNIYETPKLLEVVS